MRNRESKVEPSKGVVVVIIKVELATLGLHANRKQKQLHAVSPWRTMRGISDNSTKSDAPASLASELECRYFPCAVHVQAVWGQAGFPLLDIVSQSAGCANGSPWPEETAIRVVSWLLGFFASRRVDDMEVGGLEAKYVNI